MSKQPELKEMPDVVKIIKEEIGRLLGSTIQCAIVSADGTIYYIDPEIQKFSDFIISFAKGNFTLLQPGDHSLPLSGTNIAFFKVTEKSLVILNSDKGPVGQLLAFKGRMLRYGEKIDMLLEAAIVEEETKASAKAAVRVPVLTVSISNKKFGMEEAKVLHLVNGENTISDICEKTNIPQLKVDEILRKYQKKGWIKLKRLIIGAGKELEEPEVEEGPKPISAIPVKYPTEVAVQSRFPLIEQPEQELTRPQARANPFTMPPPVKSPPQIAESIPELPPQPSPPLAAASEENVLNELMELIETTQPIRESPPTPQFQPNIPSTPRNLVSNQPRVPSIPKPTFSFAPPPAPEKVIPSPPQPTPKAPAPADNIEMTAIKGEPVSDSLFTELSSLLDKTAPMAAFPPTPSTAPVPAQKMAPSPIPVSSPPSENPPTDLGGKQKISGDSLLQDTAEGIKITVYPEEDPLKNRLQRLSNILEETTSDISSKAKKEGVEIQGSKAVCPNCRALVIIMSKICPNCQRPLRTCPNCNAAITLFARICPSCGSLL